MHATQQSAGTSARKVEANRANAQKSTGPTSEAGRQRSSQNAKRHGLLTGAATLLAQPNQELQALLSKYTTRFKPSDPHEELLVRELAVADFRMKQLDTTALGLMSFQMQAT